MIVDGRVRTFTWLYHGDHDGIISSCGAHGLLVYVSLLRYADAEGRCWPSAATLADRAGISERAVRSAIASLKNHGYIEVNERRDTTGAQRSNEYVVLSRVAPRAGGPASDAVAPMHDVHTPHAGGADRSKTKRTKNQDEPESFARFWLQYPIKVGRANALRAWMKLSPDDDLVDEIINAVSRHALSRQWKQGYIPHAATYINGMRWLDELPQSEAVASKASANANAFDVAVAMLGRTTHEQE